MKLQKDLTSGPHAFDMNEISCHCEQCFDTVHGTLFESDCRQVKSFLHREAHNRRLGELQCVFGLIAYGQNNRNILE